MLLLAVAGMIIAAMRWKRHPRVSLLTIIAMIIYVVDAFVLSFLIYYVPPMFYNTRSPTAVSWVYFFLYFFDDFVIAATIVLLVAAAFIGRRSLLHGISTQETQSYEYT